MNNLRTNANVRGFDATFSTNSNTAFSHSMNTPKAEKAFNAKAFGIVGAIIAVFAVGFVFVAAMGLV